MKKNANSIYDISQALNLSPSTVSRVLNHPEQVRKKTRDRVLQYMQETGFRKRTYTTSRGKDATPSTATPLEPVSYSSVYLMSIPSASNPFYADIIEGAMTAAVQHSCRIFVDYSSINDRTIHSFLDSIGHSFRGMISLQPLSERLLHQLVSRLPVVQCSEAAPKYPEVSGITIDNVQAEKKAVEYLISLGCKSFTFLTSLIPYHFAQERLQGMQLAMDEARLPLLKDQIIRVSSLEYRSAYDAILLHLKKTRPDAIVCISDVFAAACINAAHALSIRVPEDLMVLGFDNISVSVTTTPSITTISQPRFQLGFHAFEMIYRETQMPHLKKTQTLLPTELLIRNSTGSPA